jgi:hypothetical protein
MTFRSTGSRVFLTAFAFAGALAFAEQSTTEKGSATAHDGARKMKKMGHRMQEAVCAEGDAACLAKKAKHRAEESKDYMKDKTKEGVDKMDSDSAPAK